MRFLESPISYFLGFHPLGIGELEHATFPDVLDVLDQVRPAVVITFEAFSAMSFQVSLIRRRRRFHHVVLCDSTSPPSRSLWRYAPTTCFFSSEVLRSADLFVSHTMRSTAALQFLHVPDSRVHTIPAGIPCNVEKTATDIVLPGFRLLYIGALRRNKGLRTLVSAFIEVRRQIPDAELWVGGAGPLAAEMAAAASRTPGIRYLGWVPDLEKERLYSEASLFVMPSEDDRVLGLIRWQEQTAISAIEAMGSGLPVVGSDSGALPEIIGRSEAVFQQGSAHDLAKLVERAGSDTSWLTELRRAQQERVRRMFDIEISQKSLEKIFDTLLTGYRQGS